MSLLLTFGCSAGTGVGDSGIGSAPPDAAPAPAPVASTPDAPTPVASSEESAPGAGETAAGEPPSGQAVATARASLEVALRRVFDGAKPSAEQVRGALVAAGFSAGDVQVTAGRTPTGLEADAVEVGVNQGGDCLVAQVRSGAVSVSVLPVLGDGRCLVGAAVP
ncbi:hypothetical protein QFZ79_002987 [Arthrobacter sp. V4I6]|uniref:DUF6993 domain-containing protein n=1 Tax=unclassified Arthrobacter TaxID=235627 RepID=UPI00278B5712|nr:MULTISPECIES: hypothetical protein [unclassified Arthrobacter]MDQ0854876.1 hypothetical protein [Arthrobacter sp. V4I6]